MCCQGLSYLPLLVVLLTLATFVLSYIIAVIRNDVNAYFPYISDTGTKVPESCVFGQLLNIAAALAICTIYVRYKLVSGLVQSADEKIHCLNRHALFWGLLSPLGLSLVANFQETSVEVVHIIGAAMVLGFGVVYEFIQTAMTFRMHPDYNGHRICKIRLIISVVSLITMLATFASATASRMQGHPVNRLHWEPSDGGFAAHIVSTICEWITAIAFLFFFFTFVRDFQKIKIEIVARVNVRHLDEVCYDEPNEESRLIT